MFQQLSCPILGIVENMSYYICNHCQKKDYIFGAGGAATYSRKSGISLLGQIPLTQNIRANSDLGHPLVIAEPEKEESKIFTEIAGKIASAISIKHMKN